jgi:hypothetical protein
MKKDKTLSVAIPFMIILFCVVAYKYGYLKIRSEIDSIRKEQALKLKILERRDSLLAEMPGFEKEAASLRRERRDNNSRLIAAQTYSLSAASLQEAIKGIVVDRGGRISSERVEKPEDLGAFKVISVSIDAVLPDTGALSDVLYSIETRTPYLVVKALDARVRNYRRPTGELTVNLAVSAITGGK